MVSRLSTSHRGLDTLLWEGREVCGLCTQLRSKKRRLYEIG